MRKPLGRRLTSSNLVWLGGVVAGLIAGGIVAYGVASVAAAFSASSEGRR